MSTHWIDIDGRIRKVVLPTEGPPTVDGVALPVELRELAPGTLSLLLTLPGENQPHQPTQSFAIVTDNRPDGDGLIANGRRIPYELTDPRSLRAGSAAAGAAGPRALKAPMPGRIVRVLVAEGETVEAGQGCVVIEAMKMQNELKAPKAGTVTKLKATEGETVAANAVLLVVE